MQRRYSPHCRSRTAVVRAGAAILHWHSLREREEDGRAAAQFAFCAHLATVVLDDVFHDGEPEPRPALITRSSPVHSIEPLKNAVQ